MFVLPAGYEKYNQDPLKTNKSYYPIIFKSFASQVNLSCFNEVLRTFLLVNNKILKKMMINCVCIEIIS